MMPISWPHEQAPTSWEAALKANRHGHRDHMMALMTFLHGLRVSELIDLRWDDIDWRKGTIQIRRLKGNPQIFGS
jgi:integrase